MLCAAQFGSGVGISPMTIGVVVVKTIAAIMIATLSAKIKMGTAEILAANRT
jgi:hypothetical protein